MLFFGANSLYANCIQSCGSINDGKCDVNTVTCAKETDPLIANCNRMDSTTSGGANCPPT